MPRPQHASHFTSRTHSLKLEFDRRGLGVLRSVQFDSGNKKLLGRHFRWSVVIKAFAYAMLRYKLWNSASPYVFGKQPHEQSLAKSLGYAVEQGEAGTLRHILPDYIGAIFIGSPRHKAGYLDVLLEINSRVLPRDEVEVYAGSEQLTAPSDLETLAELIYAGGQWKTRKESEAFSPLRALDSPVDDFTGRIDEKQKLVSALKPSDGVRIAMVHGMPGSGKTQLALVVAREISPLFPGHQFVVKLRGNDQTSFSAAHALASAIRSLKGLNFELPPDVEQMRDVYLRSLSQTNSLVVVDNAVEPGEVEDLVPPDGCTLIVTSRERIALSRPVTERIGALGELMPEDAEGLLRGICQRVSIPIAKKICRHCGYLPLAIRAAGNLLDTTVDLDPAQYAAQLENEHDRLDRIGHAGVPIGVEASFNLSYERLDSKTKKVFQGLALFTASFDSSAEAAICEDANNTHLHELVRRALVNFVEKNKRYVLHDLMRLFAAKQLGTNRDAAMKQYAEHFLSVYDKSDGLFAGDEHALHAGYELFAAERVNILAAWRWCAENFRASSEIAELCCRFANTGKKVAGFFLPSNERILLYEASVAAARSLELSTSASEFLSSALRRLARAHYDSGRNLQVSTKLYEEALQLANSLGDVRRRQSALGMLARNRMAEADKDRRLQESALEMQMEAYRLAVELEDTSIEMQAAGHLGEAYLKFGKPLEAIRYFQKEVDLARQFGKPREEAQGLVGISRAHFATEGDKTVAITIAEEALKIAERVGDEKAINTSATNLGRWYRPIDPDKALTFSKLSLELNRKQGNRRREAGALLDCALTLLELGNDVEAEEALQEAIAISREPAVSDRVTGGTALEELAYIVAMFDPNQAASYAEQATAAFSGTKKEFRNNKLHQKIRQWRSAASRPRGHHA